MIAGILIGAVVLGGVAAAVLGSGGEESAPQTQVAETEAEPETTPSREPEPLPPETDTGSGVATGDGEPAEGTPERTMYDHWQAIGAGDYEAAYDSFVADYSANRSRWVATHERLEPEIAGLQVESVVETADVARVSVSLTTRDAGDGAQECSRFEGEVRLLLEGGEWRYKPRPPGKKGSFQPVERNIPSDDPTCAETF